MLKFKIIFIIVFTIVVFVFYPTQEAWACTPSQYPRSILNQYIYSDIAFIGTVTNIELVKSDPIVLEPNIRLVTFDIQSKWKGDLNDTIKIQTYKDTVSCGVYFTNNTSHFILVHSNENGYPWIDTFTPNVKLTDNIGLNFIKIVLRFLIDPFVWIPLLIVIPISIGIVVIKKRKRRDSK